ncbi:palmitoyltransferase pfa5 [Tulasnella sp. 419]|nr:palmitoyltransferase pfa5 [Tulasnella sp. 418]KAG8966034.1 palmitoyltransferase pfa5 [Tulasnella sp. 419]
MPSVSELVSYNFLVVGDILTIHEELHRLSERHTVKHVPNISRQQVIADIRAVAAECRIDILFLLDGSLKFAPVNKEIIGCLLPSLRFVSGIGAGFDHIDVEYLASHGVYYSNTPNAVAFSTATTTTMLILETIRAASQAEMGVRRGEWRGRLQPTPDTRGLVVGIIGMGTIGKYVNKQVQVFGMRVIYHNRRRLSPEEENGAQHVSFDELLRNADLICLNCPLTPQTRHMISDEQIAKMRKGVFIVNTSRGAVIDEHALIRAMESGKVCRVGLDVFEKEPLVHPYFMNSERATVLPHWSTSTTKVAYDNEREGLANIAAFLSEGKPNTPVNRPVFD